MADRLLLERHGPVGWLIFNRPEVGNAMDAQMLGALPLAWAELDADPAVRVIVNTGAGERFQTGLDVVQLGRDPAALREHSRQTRRAELKITAWQVGVAKPVIAAVNGLCAGGGLHFVADTDIVIAAADAQFTDPHVSLGQATAFEGIALSRRMAAETVLRMALAGGRERLGAARAHQLGMLSEIVDPPEKLRVRAQRLAETIAGNSPAALAATRRALWGALETGLTDARRAAPSLAARLPRTSDPSASDPSASDPRVSDPSASGAGAREAAR